MFVCVSFLSVPLSLLIANTCFHVYPHLLFLHNLRRYHQGVGMGAKVSKWLSGGVIEFFVFSCFSKGSVDRED